MLSIIILCTSLIYLKLSGIDADANLRISFLPFGNLTNQFLTTIQPNLAMNITKKYIYDFIDKTQITIDPSALLSTYWKTYVGYLILIIIAIIFIIFFTLVGLICCCCRCCCKRCGAKPPRQSERKTRRKRIILNVFLFVLTTLIFIGAIVSMASNVVLLEAFKPKNDTTDKAGNILSNIETTVDYATSYINYLANNGLIKGRTVISNTIETLLVILRSSMELFSQTFQDKLNIGSVFNISDGITNGYTNLVNQAENLSTIALLHQSKSTSFDQYLQSISQNLSSILNDSACQTYPEQCNRINALLPSLIIGYNYSKINYTMDIGTPNVFKNFNVSDLINGKETVNKTLLDSINKINSTFGDSIQNFSNSLSNITDMFKDLNNTVADKDRIINQMNNIVNTIYTTKVGNGTIYSYYLYVFYAFIVLIGLILIVVLFFYVGLCFGIIGKPNYENAPCCNRAVGSGFMIGGVTVSFIFGWLIMLIVMIMFVVGGVIQTEGCRYLTVGSNPAPIKSIDEIINTAISKYNFSFEFNGVVLRIPNVDLVQSLLIRCPLSTDLISAFQVPMDYLDPIIKVVYERYISTPLMTMTKKINDYTIQSINVSPIKDNTDQIIAIITKIKSVNSTSTIVELKKNVTNVTNFPDFVAIVYNLSLVSKNSSSKFSSDLNRTIIELNKTVSEMSVTQESYLQRKINFNNSVNNLDNLLKNINVLLSGIDTNLSNAKTEAALATTSSLNISTKSLVNQTIFNLIMSLGHCQGLSSAVISAIGIVCTTFLIPFNNIWMGMGWFLLFIIPAIITSLKLHGLYRVSKVDPNEPQFNKAYQGSTHFLTARDMELIRMERPQRI